MASTVGELGSAHTPEQNLSQASSLIYHNQHKISLNSHYGKGKALPMTSLPYQTELTMKRDSDFLEDLIL